MNRKLFSTNGTRQTKRLPGKKGLWSLPHSHSKIKVKRIRDLKKIKHNKQPYANKMENTGKIHKYLEKYSMPELNREKN